MVTGMVLERFFQESSWNYACECEFVWMVNIVWGCWQCMCCCELFQPSSIASGPIVRWRNRYLQSTICRVRLFCSNLWLYFLLTFSLQYSVTSICRRFNEKVWVFLEHFFSLHNLLQCGWKILSFVIHVPSAVEPVCVGSILFVII